MILYHGSNTAVDKPSLAFCRERTDFGQGFYVTPFKEQAYRWAERFKDGKGKGVISFFKFLERIDENLPEDIRILEFVRQVLEWLSFVTACRLGQPVDREWDIVIGGVANDKVIVTLQLYFNQIISAEEAIGRLRYNKPNFQYCFKSQPVIDGFLFFTGAEEI
jgi:hypothetical protein